MAHLCTGREKNLIVLLLSATSTMTLSTHNYVSAAPIRVSSVRVAGVVAWAAPIAVPTSGPHFRHDHHCFTIQGHLHSRTFLIRCSRFGRLKFNVCKKKKSISLYARRIYIIIITLVIITEFKQVVVSTNDRLNLISNQSLYSERVRFIQLNDENQRRTAYLSLAYLLSYLEKNDLFSRRLRNLDLKYMCSCGSRII